MKRTFMGEDRGLGIIALVFGFVLFGGVAAGSIYLVRHMQGYEGLSEYLTEFFKNTLTGMDKYSVFKNALKSNLIILAVIFCAGFFKLGFIVAAACIMRKGFIIGFTSASFISCFGLKGVLVSLSYLPGLLLILPAFWLFCSVSSEFSLKKDRFQKKFIFSYIFFTIVIITIFCAASFLEGYLTTTFMNRFAALI